MSSKIAILADSSSSLDFANYPYDNIFFIRLSVFFDGVEYIDGETITNEEFFRRIVEEDVIPTSSQPSIGQVIEVCEKVKALGYTDIVYLPLSKGISSSYSSIVGSKDLIEGVNFTVIDTKSTAVYLAYMTLEAARLSQEGKSVEDIVSHVNQLTENQHIYFMVDDLKYLIKNGRLSNAAGFIATMFKIKPVLEFDEEGKIVGTEKIRTTKKTMDTIVSRVKEAKEKYKKIQMCVCHGFDEELLGKFKEQLQTIAPLDEFLILPLPCVIGAHVGNGVVSVGYFVIEE